MTVRGETLKVECWRKYTWDPDCLGCWIFYCPKHRTFERGTGAAMLAKLQEHLRKSHPMPAARARLDMSSSAGTQ